MLKSITVKRFKSLADTERVKVAPLTVLFGPNAMGKSNFLDAVQVLSRLASERTLADALGEPVRGLPLEAFMFPDDGLAGLLKADAASFTIEADVERKIFMRYRVETAISPSSGALTVQDEYLAALDRSGQVKESPRIEKVEDTLKIRRKSKPGQPIKENVGLGYTQVSDRRFSGVEYRHVELIRKELSSWRTYYLDPRVAMRSPQPPQEVDDIGPRGEHVAPFLFRLSAERPKEFDAVRRTLCAIVPSVEDLAVDLDKKRGVLDVEIRQDGKSFSSRLVSEGTLRVLALICVAVNPWGGTLLAFEEPENGVHPRRIELIAQMLLSMATDDRRPRQILVTTHSPIFCGEVIRRGSQLEDKVILYNVIREPEGTHLRIFDPMGPLFADAMIRKQLSAPTEDGVFQDLVLRGYFDG